MPESRTMRLTRLYPGTIVKPAVRTILVPRPTDRVGDLDLLAWATEVLDLIDSTQTGSAA